MPSIRPQRLSIDAWAARCCFNPLLISIAAIVALLEWLHIPYGQYMDGGRMMTFFLGPATVAMAVPIFRHAGTIGRSLPATS